MNLRIFQRGFNYSQDGPGNRLVYHLQGCNLRCPWCANPESLALDSKECVDVPIDELIDEVLRSRLMFFDGGGVTFTGGEPTVQFEALSEALTRLHAEGVHTAIETNGLCAELPSLFSRIDCLMLDIKHHDPAAHARVTGRSNEQALLNYHRACADHPSLHVRIPLISGYNASGADIDGFIRLFTAQKERNVTYELLRYHEYGRGKWEALGMPYAVKNGDVPMERYEKAMKRFREAGLTVVRS